MGERKISNGTAAIMVGFAVIFDLVNIGVDFITFGIGGVFVDAAAALFFGIWFSHLGASLWSSRNVGRTILAMLLDAIPVGDLTFPWTWQVAYTAFTERHPAPAQQAPARRSQWRI